MVVHILYVYYNIYIYNIYTRNPIVNHYIAYLFFLGASNFRIYEMIYTSQQNTMGFTMYFVDFWINPPFSGVVKCPILGILDITL